IVPSIASQVSNLYVFQRTPNWLAPTPNYRSPVEDGMHQLLRQLPTYAQWYRFWLFWKNCEGMLPLVQVDENWPNQEKSVSMLNDFLREILTIYLTSEFEGREDLLSRVIPDYPPSAKRVIRDDGSWAEALKRPNVELVCQNIDQISENGIRLADGRLVEVDVIIYATGFQASDFLTPMKVIGQDGRDIHTWWNGDAQAYLGVSIPRFPNFFMLYGPNTNIVINGSIIYFSECGTNYILSCIKHLIDNSLGALSVKETVCARFNDEIDLANQKMAWGASSVNSWYKNSKGRVSQNWPYTLHEYWRRTSNLSPEDFEFIDR
ncbi:MAG: NAD(P)/FAD-dependent oxidoreductase, partial [Acidimicrobiales bacterium]|nr:NAD(P)/FAD-dependent oxidoreductase [Acidimicrobiales bacterium]